MIRNALIGLFQISFIIGFTALAEATDGCRTYENGKCVFCEQGYNHIPNSDGSCTKCAYSTCWDCPDDPNICTNCGSTEYQYWDGKFWTDGYSGAEYYLTTDGRCETCDSLYPGCRGDCGIDNKGRPYCYNGCDDGSTMNPWHDTCSQCSELMDGCNSCGDSYEYYVECFDCSEGYDLIDGTCVKSDETSDCISPKYTLDGYRECESCQPGFGLDVDNDCQACAEGCSECGDDYEYCDICSEGYEEYDGSCYKAPDNCNSWQMNNNFSDYECLECQEDYLNKNGECVLESKGCGDGYLGKDGKCIDSSLGCGAGYKDMGGFCNRIQYTPAEAATILNDDNNSVTITFKK